MACLCQRHVAAIPSSRAFSTTARRSTSLHIKSNLRDDVSEIVPEYPYGPARLYKQGSRGLYGGSRIQFGNTTAEENMPRARRSWSLNVKRKRLYSEALDQTVQLQVTTRVLRTINKYGGLDEYLLGEKPARIKELGETGWWLRWAIMQTDTVKARFEEESRALLAQRAQEQDKNSAETETETETNSQLPADAQSISATIDVTESKELASDEILEPVEPSKTDEHNENKVSQTPLPLAPRLRRITFRVDRGKHVIFNGRTWVAKYRGVQRAAWQRDIAKMSILQKQRTSSEEEKSDIEHAAQYIKTSLRNKKLQRGMPPSVVAHRQWLKQSAGHVRANTKAQGNVDLEATILKESLKHENQVQIARALDRRTKANAFRR